ncbi:leucine-rich repeat and calponin homology domain-containing protein 1-like [Acanthopagrus latus]|uniref:leucine-rich repeat and calponin homology domain-containing protein 1-like n=1 Tax=Acanthopagrus latus TaxID=8177 RepID=UPI00187BF777|nr:leucine-rich repeat and calponin homology domain-containing protein 1-like [Acanthopagrus latus]
MATLGQESALSQLGSSPSIQIHIGSGNLPPNRGLERALEEGAASGVLNLSSRKLKEFPRTATNHDLTDTVEAVRPRWLLLFHLLRNVTRRHTAE